MALIPIPHIQPLQTGRSQWARPAAPYVPYINGEEKGEGESKERSTTMAAQSPRKTVTFSPRLVTIRMEEV